MGTEELQQFLTDNTGESKLQKKSSTTSNALTVNQKQDEETPLFVQTDELLPLYISCDFSFRYMYAKCIELSGLKGIPLALEQISLWYMEMLREKWTREKFDEQFRALKMQKIFGSFDWAHWQEGIEMIPVQTVRDRAIAEINRYAEGIRYQTAVLRSRYDHVVVNKAAINLEELRTARLELNEVIHKANEEYRQELRNNVTEYIQHVNSTGDISGILDQFPDLEERIIRKHLSQFAKAAYLKKVQEEESYS